MHVVVVVVTFTHHQPVDAKQVLGGIIGLVVHVTVFVRIPVDDNAVQGTHYRVDRHQQEPPQRRSQEYI
jgi:hypothetical protein